MHTFITGSTGSGKSNTVYGLVRQLKNLDVKFMVIEPAKGEYKNVFGRDSDVSVYGTNTGYTDLLRINPFCFPKGIHVLEHIDRLIEIFNVCWPMYAAMPAVLKESVLRAYSACGWDMTHSVNRYCDQLFPTFSDLLAQLEEVIQESAYSEEVKGNYIGSLVTRIRSLTNGLNGSIFSADEIDSEKLFDSNVIVDLSRVGTAEGKSLIMGVLIMRLNEYRMSSCDGMNASLRHVTVLEEAHNLLRRNAPQQSEDGGNLAAKSVEMLSNAIAEMRTYGEGFIIADQSPGAVDISAIRNTNTKIIMRLPEEADRRLAGKAAALRDDQLDEIAKLPRGVAVVYQNNWIEPVLCRIDKFNGEERLYRQPSAEREPGSRAAGSVIGELLRKSSGQKLEQTLDTTTQQLLRLSISAKSKISALRALRKNDSCRPSEISSVIYELACTEPLQKEAELAESIEDWRDVFVYGNGSPLAELDEEFQTRAVECILWEDIHHNRKPAEYMDIWKDYLKGKCVL